jgi:hypothetical protein
MFAEPQQEHHWLKPLVGNWKYETDCVDHEGTAHKQEGTAVGRTLGGMWYVVESEGDMGGTPWNSMITLGYDPELAAYVGSFVGSVMNRIWHYKGTFDPETNKLVLDTRGPKFDGSGMADFQDMVEIIDDDHWVLSSRVKSDSGEWIDFMTSHHYRQK